MSSSDYSAEFQKLGLAPTENWQEVKSAYRKLARKWHPDRYTDSATERTKAEEKLKEINQAYKKLSDYYKKHSRLPPKKVKRRSYPPKRKYDHKTTQDHEAYVKPKPVRETDYSETYASKQKVASKPRQPSNIFFIVVIGFSLFLLLYEFDNELPPQTRKPTGTTEKNSSESRVQKHKPKQVVTEYFTYGSTLGKVHSVQGVPTKTEGDIWYYGKSEVIFEKGRVVKWINDPDTPLHASATKIKDKFQFGYGSTINDVLRAQGRPSLMSQNLWQYGLSIVYFENGIVTKWHNSPSDPLNIIE